MSIEYIKVETSRLRQDKQNISSNLKNIRADMKNIYAEVKELDAMWDGNANESFNRQFQNDYSTICEILDEMDQFAEKMTYAYNKYEKCESEIKELVNLIKI